MYSRKRPPPSVRVAASSARRAEASKASELPEPKRTGRAPSTRARNNARRRPRPSMEAGVSPSIRRAARATRTDRFGLQIINGNVVYEGRSAGRVSPNGGVWVNVSQGGQQAAGQGRLARNHGTGVGAVMVPLEPAPVLGRPIAAISLTSMELCALPVFDARAVTARASNGIATKRRGRGLLVGDEIVDQRQQHAARGSDIGCPDAPQRHIVDLLGERHELRLQGAALVPSETPASPCGSAGCAVAST